MDPGARQSALISSAEVSPEVWHRRLGHLAYSGMAKLPSLVDGMEVDTNTLKKKMTDKELCSDCVAGKMTRNTRESSLEKSTTPLYRHTDLCGPMQDEGMGGDLYFMTFLDKATRYAEVVLLKANS